MLRYLAGETEDMIETVSEKENKELKVVILDKEEEEDIIDGEAVEDDEIEDYAVMLEVGEDFIDDAGEVVADVLLNNSTGDTFSEAREEYCREEIKDSIKHALTTADFSVQSFEFWFDTVYALGGNLKD